MEDAERQEDPVQILPRLCFALDDLEPGDQCSATAFHSTYVVQRLDCPSCAHVWHEPSESVIAIESAVTYPKQNGQTLPQMIARSLAFSQVKSYQCPSQSCQEELFQQVRVVPRAPGKLFKVEVAWDLRGSEARRHREEEDQVFQFDIPLVLSSGDLHTHRAHGDRDFEYVLSGIICRLGPAIGNGHYVAIIRHEGSWWCIDDHRVTKVTNPSTEAYKGAKYPVLILYRRRWLNVQGDSDGWSDHGK